MKALEELTQDIREKLPISTVLNIDCLEYMSTVPDLFFDWAVCDIEYGIGASKPSDKSGYVIQKNGDRKYVKGVDYAHSDWDMKKSSSEYFEQLKRISKNQIIFGGNYYGLEGGYLIWDKLNGLSDQYGCELAWLSFSNRTDIVYYMWAGMMQGIYCGKDVRKALVQQGNKKLNEKRIHETQKPVILYDWLIQEYNIRGKVFDSHLGSGSNRIAQYRNGNEFYACEIDLKKFEDQEFRFKIELSTPTLF
ncbi:putative DNA (Cytosine-5-)-methyltransferase [Chryseobacterium sp. StRB126]|uniref:DNA methyltransferase n=1 Tax=Chryseobacterium sp. StRB126 TaxID=878220 RepID=UPI0004E99BAC|nr:DNA methyltransferase [Chryseobacterium sp. StRB126]BAP30110.1 putative DNA (Cytosine-5-)-methyltransferase [Chryseobacterium sp. StRB126]